MHFPYLPNGVKYRSVKMCLSTFSGRDTTNEIGAIFNCLAGMKASLFTGETLTYNLCVLADLQRFAGCSILT